MSRPSADDADFGILIVLAARALADELHLHLVDEGFPDVRPAFGVVFRALRDGDLTLTALAARLGVTKQAAAKVVDEMVAQELVARVPDPRDARAKQLGLTERGRAVMAAALRGGARIEQRLAAEVGERTVRSLRRALVHLVLTAGADEELRERRSRALW